MIKKIYDQKNKKIIIPKYIKIIKSFYDSFTLLRKHKII